jgi:hypothetical protein
MGGYPLQIYQNPEKMVLLALLDSKGSEAKGVLLILKKIFLAEGDFTKFAASQKREFMLVEKFSKEYKQRFLALSATPAYTENSEESLVASLQKQYDEIQLLTQSTREIVEAYGAKIKDIKNSEEDFPQLFGDPLALLAMVGRGGDSTKTEAKEARVYLGIDRTRQEIGVNSDALMQAIIVGESREKRMHAMHVAIEGALLNNVPCVVFDSNGLFSGLGIPSRDTGDFQKYGMTSIPVGFPVVSLEPGKEVFVDLTLVGIDSFLEAFGIHKTDFTPIIQSVFNSRKDTIQNLVELIVEVSSIKDSRDSSRYLTNKAVRAMEVIAKAQPTLFSKKLPPEITEVQKQGGRAIVVNYSDSTKETQVLVTKSILSAMTALPDAASGISALVSFETDAQENNETLKQFAPVLARKRLGVISQCSHEVYVTYSKEFTLKIELVGSEAVVSDATTKKQHRISVRPAYSHCTENKRL